MDYIKEAFQKVRQDMDSIKEEIDSIRQFLFETKDNFSFVIKNSPPQAYDSEYINFRI